MKKEKTSDATIPKKPLNISLSSSNLFPSGFYPIECLSYLCLVCEIPSKMEEIDARAVYTILVDLNSPVSID
jgi:hypothetical protein